MRLINMVGEKYGKLRIIERAESNKNGHVCWKCVCDCGATKTVESGKLRSGHTKSCGCLHGRGRGHIKADRLFKENLAGKKFGRLLVVDFAENGKSGETRFFCVCDCGKKKIVSRQNLVRGKTVSCGCYQDEQKRKRTGDRNPAYKHGMTRKHRLWDTFYHMKGRCYTPKEKSYINYGARGIAVCKTWRNDFERFYRWAIKNGYRDTLEIDRINNNGPYAPWNCQFITKQENIKKRFNQSGRYLPI